MKEKDILNELYDLIKNELPHDLSYHGMHHTIDVHNICKFYIEHYELSEREGALLEIAAVAHDMGFIKTYKNHEQVGSEMAAEIMESYKFKKADIKIVKNLILATKIPQSPTTFLGKIICDADLDYLGRPDFLKIGVTLKEEWITYGIFPNLDEDFDKIQVGFLQGHQYHTDFAREHRTPVKLKHLEDLQQRLQTQSV